MKVKLVRLCLTAIKFTIHQIENVSVKLRSQLTRYSRNPANLATLFPMTFRIVELFPHVLMEKHHCVEIFLGISPQGDVLQWYGTIASRQVTSNL